MSTVGGEAADAWRTLHADVVACARCPRLRAYCREVARVKRRAFADQVYWGKPVPGFGDPEARVLIMGLAPAAHGGNRTCLLYTSPSPRDLSTSRMPSSA